MKRTDNGTLKFPRPPETGTVRTPYFPVGTYRGSIGQLEISQSERYHMIAFTPEAFETPVRKYTWYFLPNGHFDGTSGELKEPLGTEAKE